MMSQNNASFSFDTADRFRNRFAPLGGVGNESTPFQIRPQRPLTVSHNTGPFSALSLDDKLSQMFSKLENLEAHSQHITNMASQINDTKAELNSHSTYLKKLAYHSIDQEARSRRNNLIFYGLADIQGENAVETIRQFLYDQFDLDLDTMGFQRIHRLGSIVKARRLTQHPKRPIIVAFIDYRDTEYIMSHAYRLAGTYYGVDRDHPREIAEARKSLWNFKKQQGYSVRDKVAIQYPAKLVVNGREVRNEFPDWHTVLNESRLAFFIQNDTHESSQTVSHTDSHVYSVATDIDQRDMTYSDHSTSTSDQARNSTSVQNDFSTSDTSQTQSLRAQRAIPDNRSPAPTMGQPAPSVHVTIPNTADANWSNRDFPPLPGRDPDQDGNSRLLPNGENTHVLPQNHVR